MPPLSPDEPGGRVTRFAGCFSTQRFRRASRRVSTRFLRRGRVKVLTEWRLHMMTHNLTKLYNRQMAGLAA